MKHLKYFLASCLELDLTLFPQHMLAVFLLPLKIFWLDKDKFPGDAAKIIDQLESFLLQGGGDFGLSSHART